jgi:hypothetical protein
MNEFNKDRKKEENKRKKVKKLKNKLSPDHLD